MVFSPISDKRDNSDHVGCGGPDGIGDNGDCGVVIRVMVMVTMIRRVIVLLHAPTAKNDQVCVIGECCPSPRHVTNVFFTIHLPPEITSMAYISTHWCISFHKVFFQRILSTRHYASGLP